MEAVRIIRQMTRPMEMKLYDIFEKRLERLESETFSATEAVRKILLNDKWNQCLDFIGIERISWKVVMVKDENPDHIVINDPLVFGGDQGIISIKKETAMKILTLGDLP